MTVPSRQPLSERVVQFPIDGESLEGNLSIPSQAKGLVLFAHGSGSGRFSPRNQYVAKVLQDAALATFLFDLLTRREEQIDMTTRHLRFDIELLAGRLVIATDWALGQPDTGSLPIGYFGASTGAAAALVAAARRPQVVKAVVSRGGRPDLAGDALEHVQAPTLLIVGGEDREVIELNRMALARLKAPAKLEIVPGATHLFEEPGTLEMAARLARDWFLQHLAPAA